MFIASVIYVVEGSSGGCMMQYRFEKHEPEYTTSVPQDCPIPVTSIVIEYAMPSMYRIVEI